jgi:hypothetical protein
LPQYRTVHIYIYVASAAPGTHLALFTDDTCFYATEKLEGLVLCKLQRGLTAVNSWFERWNIKMDDWKIQVIYVSRRLRVSEEVLQLNGRDIPIVNNVTYLGVIFDRRITWRHYIEETVAKVLRTYIRTYSLIRSSRLSTNIKHTLYKALIRAVMTYLSHLGVYGGRSTIEIAEPEEQSTPRYWKSSQVLTSPRIARGFENSLRL